MNYLRESSEDEMISEFLRAEYLSERFSEQIKSEMSQLLIAEHVILEADIESANENAQRKKLLGEFRGYGLNQEMFERFPAVTAWNLCSFSSDDLERIRYIDYSYWNELSAGTHLPMAAAETIRKGITIYGQDNDGFLRAAEYIRSGGTFPRMFFLSSDFDKFVIVEGHLRMTAYALAPECFNQVEVIVGKCDGDELSNWM